MLSLFVSKTAPRTIAKAASRVSTRSAVPSVSHIRYDRQFSTSKDEIAEKAFSSNFDEADSLEVGKASKAGQTILQDDKSQTKASVNVAEVDDTANFSDEFDESDSIEVGKKDPVSFAGVGSGKDDDEPKSHQKKSAEWLEKNQTGVLEKSFKPEFDESDALEVGKTPRHNDSIEAGGKTSRR
jgi:hypothetical protein